MITVKDIDRKVMDSLDIVRGVYPDAFIAGGYLRDLHLGYKPKDVDFFTFLPPVDDSILSPQGGPSDGDSDNTRVLAVETDFVKELAEVPIEFFQIIHSAPFAGPLEVVQRFCFGIQQIWYDKGWIGATDAYHDDRVRRRITVTRCASVDDAYAIRKKWFSLRDRFGDWPLYVPDQFQEMFDKSALIEEELER